jgi:replicative DNA helicase
MLGEVVQLQPHGGPARPFVRPAPRERADLFDVEAERAVLGSLMLAGDDAHGALDRVRTMLSAESFHDVRHVAVFEAMCAARGRGVPFDVYTIAHELRVMQRFNAVGGSQFVGELAEALPTVAWIESHARIVAEHAARRRLREYAHALADRATDLSRSVAEVRDRAAEAIRRIPVPGIVARGMGDDLDGLHDEHERRLAGVESPALSTGLRDLDRCLNGGLRPGLHFIAARPGVGKTPMALQIALHVAQHAGPAYFVSKEIVRRELVRAAMANRALIALDRLMDPSKLTETDRGAWSRGAQEIQRLPLVVHDLEEPGCPNTAGEIGAAVESYQAVAQKKVRIVVLDHFAKFKTGRRVFDRVQEAAEVSDALRCLAVRLGIPIVVLIHLKRMKPGRNGIFPLPTMDDVAGADDMSRDAASVILLHREDRYPTKKYDEDQPPMEGLVDVFVPKARGAKGAVRCKLRLHGQFQRWTGVDAEPGIDDQPRLPAHVAADFDEDSQQEVPF